MSSAGGAAGKERLRSASNRQKQRGGKGYHIALAYRGGVVLRRPVYTNRGTHYFDLYGCVSMFYDSVQDVLMLSCYGNYYRVE